MKAFVCLCPTCTRSQYYLHVYNKKRKEWLRQSDNWRKMNIIEEKRVSVMDNEYVFSLIDNNPTFYQCKACNGACRDGSL